MDVYGSPFRDVKVKDSIANRPSRYINDFAHIMDYTTIRNTIYSIIESDVITRKNMNDTHKMS